jgi:hypothetical protein
MVGLFIFQGQGQGQRQRKVVDVTEMASFLSEQPLMTLHDTSTSTCHSFSSDFALRRKGESAEA